ncbi:MAG: TIGR02147 family protein [Bacteriovoracaceae bacterium]|nr:TIGR02147 family protein [Bacteriovoracaceae bacterium]
MNQQLSKSIFNYDDPNLFIKERWDYLKKENPRLSVRSWAKYLDLNAHGPLHQMLQGKRKISPSYIPKFIQYFKMNDKESFYFDVLVKFSRAQTSTEADFYLETLRELRPEDAISVEILDHYEIQKDPIHFFITELALLTELPNDFKFIQKKLNFKYNSIEVKHALELLISSGLLEVTKSNTLRKTSKHLYSTQDKKNLALVQYHKKLCTMAHAAVEGQDVLEREFNASAFNIEKDKMPEIKKEIREFLNHIIAKYETPEGEGDATYQMNLQLFKVAEK